MTKPRFILSALMALAAAALTAQTPAGADEALTASKCLAQAPTSVFPLIDKSTRLDMLDYFEAGVERASSNSLLGECIITSLSPQSVTLQGGQGIAYQLFVLNPDSPAPLIGLIETLQTPIDDSSLTLYTPRWHKTSAAVPSPTLADWLKPQYAKERRTVEETLPFIMATYAYDPDTRQLTVSHNMRSYYTEADTPQCLDYIKDTLVYRWDGKNFKPVK